MEGGAKLQGKVVTGVIGDDVHVIGIRILEHVLRDAGLEVVSLGAQVSQEEFVNSALETNADAILISSMSGHAKILIPGLREKCIEAGLTDILLYLGGHLVIGRGNWDEEEKEFNDMGINKVYSHSAMPSEVIKDLAADLALRRGRG